MSEKLISIREVCGILNVSRMTVNRWSKKPGFPAPFKMGNTVRYKHDEILAWVDAHLVTS